MQSAPLPNHLSDNRSVSGCIIDFSRASFNFECFKAAGISVPMTILRSVESRQAQFFFGRRAAESALFSAGSRSGSVGMLPSRAPKWPAGFVGSISHTDTIAAAVAGPKNSVRSLGIDIERIIKKPLFQVFNNLVLHPQELDFLMNNSHLLSKELLYTLIFSAKETFYKWAYPLFEIDMNFQDIIIVDVNSIDRYCVFASNNNKLSNAFSTNTIRIPFDYVDEDHVLTCLTI